MTQLEQIAFEKMSRSFMELQGNMNEIFNIAKNEPERLKDRLLNYQLTGYGRQIRDITTCFQAINDPNT